MELSGWKIPIARLPTVVTTQIAAHLPYPVPLEPAHNPNGNVHSTEPVEPVPNPEVLDAIAGALCNADISHVKARHDQVQFRPLAGSLEYEILRCNQHAFSHATRPLPATGQVPQPAAAEAHAQQQQTAQQAQAEPVKQARPLLQSEAQVPVAKRRKRIAAVVQEFITRSMDVQQVAGEVAAVVSSFLARAEALLLEHNNSSSEPDSDEGGQQPQQQQIPALVSAAETRGSKAGHKSSLSKPFIPVDLLRELHASLSRGKQAGIIHQLDTQQLRQLLLLLLGHVQLGDAKLLDTHDTATSACSRAIAASLEAACCCLQVLAAPELSNSLYLDELLTAIVQVAKYQLQYNVLALHHEQFKQLYRPSSIAEDQYDEGTAGRKRVRAEGSSRMQRVVQDLQTKLEMLISLLAQVLDCVLLDVELLLPLVRMALTSLQVDTLQLLQTEAIALTVAVFKAFPQQRTSVMDEVLTTVIANISVMGSRGPARFFQATNASTAPLPIMAATALVMQLVEASVQLPAVDADADVIRTAFTGAYGSSDRFWKGIFSRLPAAKAAKSDGAADFKLVVEALLADLLSVQMLPEWHVSTFLLRRFLRVLYSDLGLKHSDTAVKLAAVEFTGQLIARLCAEALIAEQTVENVQGFLQAAKAAAGDAAVSQNDEQLATTLLLDHLAVTACGRMSESSGRAAAARRFVCCRMLNDHINRERQPGGVKLSTEQLSVLLVQHRQLQDNQQQVLADLQLDRVQLVSIVRWLEMLGPLGLGRLTLIRWLVEAGSRQSKDPNPATVRTKVFKCLGNAVEADARVVMMQEVKDAVRAALEDDSVAVREAALEVLAKLMHCNPALVGEHFEVLAKASQDPGVSVRKRAIRALWDCCTCPGFAKATDAVMAVLQRVKDTEDSMKSMITKFCGDMWFHENSSFGGLSDMASSADGSVRTADVRARELADVAAKAYEAGGKAIHVPLPSDHELVMLLREVLGTSGSSVNAKELALMRAGAAEVAQALLNMVLQQQDHEQDEEQQAGGEDSADPLSTIKTFPYLLALHALCCADASLAAPEADPQRFVRCLAPYISAAGVQQGILTRSNSTVSGSNSSDEDSARRSAEVCLCLVSIVDSLIRHLGVLEQDIMKQMLSDLVSLINKQRYLQLVAAGCQTLCSLAALYKPAHGSIAQLATKCYNLAETALSHQQGRTAASPMIMQSTPKVLFILGQLCRYGASIIDASAAADSSKKNCTECLELCIALWLGSDSSDNPMLSRVRDAALQALGMMIIGKPTLMLQPLQLSLLSDQNSGTGNIRVSDRGSPSNTEAGAGMSAAAAHQQQQNAENSTSDLPRTAAEVYHAALVSGPVYVKLRVLTNLVELLRSEEAVLVARQKESEAAASTSRLPSTKPSEATGQQAKVNETADAAVESSSSSIIQRVWEDVLRLATGVPAGMNGIPTTPGMATAAAGEATQMRRKAVELIEVVMRGGLVAPWTAVPPLVAQLTDEAPDTRQAALKTLSSAAQKYHDYVANQLAPGVIEAYNFQSRLWSAKHPGQPMPKGPGAGVLEGLASMYQQIVASVASDRSKFLSNLLKPFASACSLADAAAVAKEDMHKLSFMTFVAAALPYKKADEPLTLIHSINSHVSRQAQEVLDCLKRQLLKRGLASKMGLEENDEDAAAVLTAAAANGTDSHQPQQELDQQHGQQGQDPQQHKGHHGHNLPLPQPLLDQDTLAPLKASLALSMLLALKQYLMAAYSLADERVAAFELKGERNRAEQKVLISRARQVGEFSLTRIDLKSQHDATGDLLAEQYKVFHGLLECDAANYKEAAVLAALEDVEGEEAGLDAQQLGTTPAAPGAAARATGTASAGLVLYSMDNRKQARVKSSAKGGSTAGKAGSTARRRGKAAGGSTTGRGKGGSSNKRGRRKRISDTEDSDDEDWDEGPIPSKELF